MKGLALEFGIGVRDAKCLNDGATRRSKRFYDRFSRFDTIPAVTDSHPASHVAVAIRLYICYRVEPKNREISPLEREREEGYGGKDLEKT